MPRKRKSSDAGADGSSDHLKSKRKRKSIAKNRATSDRVAGTKSRPSDEAEAIKTITYNEFLDGGIPDTLLEGLGFVESQVTARSSSPESEPDHPCNELNGWYGAVLTTGTVLPPNYMGQFSTAQTTSNSEVLSSQPGSTIGKTVTSSAAGHEAGNVVSKVCSNNNGNSASTGPSTARAQSKLAMMRAPPIRSSERLIAKTNTTCHQPNESTTSNQAHKSTIIQCRKKSVDKSKKVTAEKPSGKVPSMHLPVSPVSRSTGPRIVTRGNIVYERLPTGEVVASLVKKPTPTGNESSPCTNLPVVSQPAPRVTTPQTHLRTKPQSPFLSNLDQCPDGYPINESNVVAVLEESTRATQSMRVLLMSMRDELRRVGGMDGPIVNITEEQAQKRQEVAGKLCVAYRSYRNMIDEIESVKFLSMSDNHIRSRTSHTHSCIPGSSIFQLSTARITALMNL